MAQVKLETPFVEIHGAIAKRGIISRQKKYYDERGRVIYEGKQEAYTVRHPRDFEKTPPQGNELANMNLWREACLRALQILHAEQYRPAANSAPSPAEQPARPAPVSAATHSLTTPSSAFYTPEEALSLLDDFRNRFRAQLPTVRGTHPDPEVPLDRTTRSPKRYHHLPSFIRALIYHNLKQSHS